MRGRTSLVRVPVSYVNSVRPHERVRLGDRAVGDRHCARHGAGVRDVGSRWGEVRKGLAVRLTQRRIFSSDVSGGERGCCG